MPPLLEKPLRQPPEARRPEQKETGSPRRRRVAYLDNLKWILVAVIIVAHGVAAYSDLESAWPYQDVQEVQLSAVANGVLGTILLPGVLFAMGLFFLISGLITPGSVTRKGPRIFARDRLVRLGIPLAIWVLLLWPGAKWLAHLAAGDTQPFTDQLFSNDPLLDTGPMWFVEVLLIYSLAYAAWRQWGPQKAIEAEAPSGADQGAPLRGRTLAAIAVGISVATMLVRLVFPLLSGEIGQSHLWQWPQFVAMFGLGIVAAGRGWLDPVPDRIRRGCGITALLGILGFLAVAGATAAAGLDPEVWFEERLHWAPLALAALEGPLAVGACVWLLALAQRHLDRTPSTFTRTLSRSAYAAFMLQGIVLIALMIAMRPVGVPAEVKALVVASLGLTGSFGLAWLLVARTRVGRIL